MNDCKNMVVLIKNQFDNLYIKKTCAKMVSKNIIQDQKDD